LFVIRFLRSAARFTAARLALAAMLCFVLQGALAGAVGQAHAHDSHPHHHHAHHTQAHHAHSHAHAVHAHAAPDAAAADLGQQPDSGTTADFDWTCCGSTACSAVLLVAAATLAPRSVKDLVTAGVQSPPVLGFVGEGPRRPPRSPVLA
jgi:hypothetical protein